MASDRVVPWRAKASSEVTDRLLQVANVQLYLVQRLGPTSFVVREENSDVKRKVVIGSRMACSCCTLTPVGTVKESCVHILFVLVKVLRVPASNPLVWQLSLLDRELDEVLRCSTLPDRPAPEPKARPAPGKVDPGQVKRRAVDEEEPCPICYEEMAGCDLDALVWCRFGCGRNVHGKCMGVWMDHQVKSLGKELSCPLCRTDWGDFKWKPPPPKRKQREERRDVHYGTHCGACKKAPLIGKRYCCLICADFDLCDACFTGGHHPQHPFAVKDTPQSFGAPADRAVMMPASVRLTAPLGEAGAQQAVPGTSTSLAAAAAGPGIAEAHGPPASLGLGLGLTAARAGRAAPGAVARPAQQNQHQHQQNQTQQLGRSASNPRQPVRGRAVAHRPSAGSADDATGLGSDSFGATGLGRQPALLHVEGLNMGIGLAPALDLATAMDQARRRAAALGKPPVVPVVIRRAKSTARDDSVPVDAGAAAALSLGLTGVQLGPSGSGAGGHEAGPGPSSLTLRPSPGRLRAGGIPRYPVLHAGGAHAGHPHPQEPALQPEASPGFRLLGRVLGGGPAAAAAAAAADGGWEAGLQGSARLHAPHPCGGRAPSQQRHHQPSSHAAPAAAHAQQHPRAPRPRVGLAGVGPGPGAAAPGAAAPPGGAPPHTHALLRRSHSAGHRQRDGQGQGELSVTARAMAPTPLHIDAHPHGRSPTPDGAGYIQLDTSRVLAFTHALPGYDENPPWGRPSSAGALSPPSLAQGSRMPLPASHAPSFGSGQYSDGGYAGSGGGGSGHTGSGYAGSERNNEEWPAPADDGDEANYGYAAWDDDGVSACEDPLSDGAAPQHHQPQQAAGAAGAAGLGLGLGAASNRPGSRAEEQLDAVLFASVAADAMDDFLSQVSALRAKSECVPAPGRAQGSVLRASTSHSGCAVRSDTLPGHAEPLAPVPELRRTSLALQGGSDGVAPCDGGGRAAANGQRSADDSLNAFMRQRHAHGPTAAGGVTAAPLAAVAAAAAALPGAVAQSQQLVPAGVGQDDDGPWVAAYSNPAFDRPYTLDMSLQ